MEARGNESAAIVDRGWATLGRARDSVKGARLEVDGPPAELETVTGGVPELTRIPYLEDDNPFPFGCSTGIGLARAEALKEDISAGELVGPRIRDSLFIAERRMPVHDGIISGDCEGLSNIYY